MYRVRVGNTGRCYTKHKYEPRTEADGYKKKSHYFVFSSEHISHAQIGNRQRATSLFLIYFV